MTLSLYKPVHMTPHTVSLSFSHRTLSLCLCLTRQSEHIGRVLSLKEQNLVVVSGCWGGCSGQELKIGNFPPHYIYRESSQMEWVIYNENVTMVSCLFPLSISPTLCWCWRWCTCMWRVAVQHVCFMSTCVWMFETLNSVHILQYANRFNC
jgi:hypothetical protein